ncbi:uncharacterized protein [Littorina saxatilis]|uniref:Fucolectin-related molecule n=1 Tax=Littorina saxatilis TaxID=31220 RepID=A0AAN9G3T7_9CAEN
MRGFLLISLVACVLSPVTHSSQGARHARSEDVPSDALKPLNAAQRDQPPAHTGWNSTHTGRNSAQDASSADLVSRLSSQVQSDADPPHSPAARVEAEETVPRLEPEAVIASVRTAGVKSHTRPSPPTQQAAREGSQIPLSADRVTTTSTPKPTSVHRVQSRQGAEEKGSGPPPSPTRHSTDDSSSVQPLLKGKEGDREAGNVTDTVEGRNDKHDTPSHDAQRQSREDSVKNIQTTPLTHNREAEQPHRQEENASLRATLPLLDDLGEGDDTAADVFPGLAQRNQNQSENHGRHRRKRGTVNYSPPCLCEGGCKNELRTEYSQGKSFVNFLLGKPVESSSQQGAFGPPCVLTDGRFEGLSGATCWSSATSDYAPWVIIDMETELTVATIFLYKITQSDTYKNTLRSTSVSVDGVHCGDIYDYGDNRPEASTYIAASQGFYTVKCRPAIKGRYIRIYKRERVSHYMRMMSLCVASTSGCPENEYGRVSNCKPCPANDDCPYRCDNLRGCNYLVKYNVAIKKTTSQSSTKWGNSAYAVDGITRVWDNTLCTSTNPAVDGSSGGWWQVDLGQVFVVYNVLIYSRFDCCAEDLPAQIRVFVDNIGFSATTRPTNMCLTITRGALKNGEHLLTSCPRLRGQWVALLSMDENKALAFCEVQVWGEKPRYIAAGKSCRFQNDVTGCEPGLECNSNVCEVPLAGDCTGDKATHCAPRSFCDSGFCKIPLLGSCVSTSTCRFGTVCDRGLCKWKVQEKCATTQQCVTGTMCDSLKKCKIPIGDTCLESDKCVAGAECKVPPGSPPGPKKCICRNLNSSNACDPRDGFAGGACPCTTANAACNSNVCTCSTGYTPYSIDLTCRLEVSQRCTSNDECVSGLCDVDNKCKWQTGHRCQQGECQGTAVCDGEFCKTKPGIACSLTEALCMTGASCEDRGLGSVCKVRTGQPCDGSDDQCNMATVCANTTLNNQTTKLCVLRPGQSCDGANTGLCEPNSVCEKKECKLKLLTSCAGDLSTLCKAGTTCDNGTCKIGFGNECTENKQCKSNTTCDAVQKKCYLLLGQGCEENPEGCVTGTTCNESRVCSCTTSGAVNLDTCAPKAKYVGGACTVSGDPDTPDCNPGAFCNPIGKCQCSPEFALERTNFTCGQGVGSTCNATHWCVTGTTCDPNRLCKLEVKQRCDGRNLGNCKVGTFCDNGVCQLSMGQDCHGTNRDACGTGSVCDITNTCKLSHGHNCGEDHVCVAGAKCTNNTCTCIDGTSTQKGSLCASDDGKVEGACTVRDCDDPNAECRYALCKCLAGYTVEASELTCKLAVGQSCKGKEHDCISGTFCDTTCNRCTVILGEQCWSTPQCQAGAICDIDKKCRMGFGGRCNRYDYNCAFGLVCDFTEKCSFGLGRACNKTEDCTMGAFCKDGTCECQNQLTPGSAICEPKQGQVFSECSEVLACTVANSACVKDVCQCNDGFTVTQTFTCKSITGSSKSAGSTSLAVVSGLGLAACIIALAIGFVGFKRHQNKTSAATDLRRKGAARMQNIQNLACEVDESLAIKHGGTGAAPSDMDPANTAGVQGSVVSEGIPILGDNPNTAPPQSEGIPSLAPDIQNTTPLESEGIPNMTPDIQNTALPESEGIPSMTPDIQNTALPESERIPSLAPDSQNNAPKESAGMFKAMFG